MADKAEWEKRRAELDAKLAELKIRNAAQKAEREARMNATKDIRPGAKLNPASGAVPPVKRDRPPPPPIPPRTVSPSGAHEYNKRDFGKY